MAEAPPVLATKVGKAFTVIKELTEFVQLEPFVYVYFTLTVPGVKPVTTPPEVIDAVPVPATIDQVPPDCVLVNAGVVPFTQTEVAPPVFAVKVGNAFIVTVAVLFADRLVVHPLEPPDFNDLIVMVVFPEFANGPIVIVPVPAVETVIVAIAAVARFGAAKS
jgi:hypothetical protein